MLKEINFCEEYLPDSHQKAIVLKKEMIDGKTWILQEIDLNHVAYKEIKHHFLDKDKWIVPLVHHIEAGIYEVASHNFNQEINFFSDSQVVNHYAMVDLKNGKIIGQKELAQTGLEIGWNNLSHLYGIADGVEQIKRKYKQCLQSDTESYVISIYDVTNEENFNHNKWGDYIGKRQDDFKDKTKKLYTFQIYQVEPKKPVKKLKLKQ